MSTGGGSLASISRIMSAARVRDLASTVSVEAISLRIVFFFAESVASVTCWNFQSVQAASTFMKSGSSVGRTSSGISSSFLWAAS